MKHIWKRIGRFWKQETVLAIAGILAVGSMFLVPPDRGYVSYIDVRTLSILFCLMTIVAGLRGIGVFDYIARILLNRVKGTMGIILILVGLCFFLSMLITNDVALITFVPLTIILMKRFQPEIRQKWLLKVIVMQTIAANLGSMLTPIGNPQNLYLYGKAGISMGAFIMLMLPYTLAALGLLILWILLASWRNRGGKKLGEDEAVAVKPTEQRRTEYLLVYGLLFILSLLAVAHLLPYWIPLILVFLYSIIRNRPVLRQVDYSLLGTFVALFIFIGNLGRIPAFHTALQNMITGKEMLTAVAASQVMSNVPAAILLAGFTDDIPALIVGTNLGGLGTLIASMASLISFKYVAREDRGLRGRYFLEFTVANVIFLAILLVLA